MSPVIVKLPELIIGILLPANVTLYKELQNKKALVWIDVTLFGMVILVKDTHPWNMALLKVVMLLGKVTVTKYTQSWNAAWPMLVTPFGMIIFVKLQDRNTA